MLLENRVSRGLPVLKNKSFFQIGLQLPLLDLYLFGESVQRVLGVGGFEVAENFGLDNV